MIENKTLYLKKQNSLKDFQTSFDTQYIFEFDFSFHEVEFSLRSSDNKIIELLKTLIPKKWIRPCISPVIIFHRLPAHYDIDPISWTNESSQDCIFDDDNILQRDFAARRINSKNYLLICDSIDSDPLHNFFRMLLPKLLLTNKSYIIHSSCVLSLDETHAYLFLGHSGFGKTTITSLSSPRKILSDDMNIISMADLRINAAALGHQFHTLNSYDNKYTIKKIFWLNKSDQNLITPLDKSLAPLKLLSSITNLFWENIDKQVIDQIMQDVDYITSSIPFFNLSFKKDSQVWKLID